LAFKYIVVYHLSFICYVVAQYKSESDVIVYQAHFPTVLKTVSIVYNSTRLG